MIRGLQLKVLCILFLATTFSSMGQDILHLRDGSEKRIIFDVVDVNTLTYRDYDDPDFKLITEKKRMYSRVVLANGKTVWLTQRDNYFRYRLGFNVGVVIPLGDFASADSSNTNAGFANALGLQFSTNLDVNIYKFVGLRAMVYYSSGASTTDYGWYDRGFAIGPEFHIKLSPRFYALIPVLYQAKTMRTDNFNYTSTSVLGDGNGSGFITGLGLHARMGQHMAIGFTCQYFQQKMQMTYNQSVAYNIPSVTYGITNKWSYLTNSVSFTVHF